MLHFCDFPFCFLCHSISAPQILRPNLLCDVHCPFLACRGSPVAEKRQTQRTQRTQRRTQRHNSTGFTTVLGKSRDIWERLIIDCRMRKGRVETACRKLELEHFSAATVGVSHGMFENCNVRLCVCVSVDMSKLGSTVQ